MGLLFTVARGAAQLALHKYGFLDVVAIHYYGARTAAGVLTSTLIAGVSAIGWVVGKMGLLK